MTNTFKQAALLWLALLSAAILGSTNTSASPITMVVMPPTFKTVHTSALTWSDIQKDLYFALEQELVSSEYLKLLNRNKLKAAMSELNIATSELANEESANKLGQLMIADWVLLTDVTTFEISHSRRKMALDDNVIQQTNLQFDLNYRIINVASQEILLSEKFTKKSAAKPVLLKPNTTANDQVSIDLAEKMIATASKAVADTIGAKLFDIKQAKAQAPVVENISSSTVKKQKNEPAIVNEDDW